MFLGRIAGVLITQWLGHLPVGTLTRVQLIAWIIIIIYILRYNKIKKKIHTVEQTSRAKLETMEKGRICSHLNSHETVIL